MGERKAEAWGETHRREAWARLWELHAERIRITKAPLTALGMRSAAAADCVDSESEYRRCLGVFPHFDPARIDREVRRVRALAEGRLVRETEERHVVRDPINGAVLADRGRHGDAMAEIDALGLRDKVRPARVRVTRIRRAK